MGFSIRDFKAEINYSGVMRTNHSQVLFSSPVGLQTEYGDIQNILIRCESAIIPGLSITFDDNIRRHGYGPIEKAPMTPLFDPFQCQFIADQNGDVYRFFNDWQNLIVNFDMSRTILSENKYGALPYEMSYRYEYVTDLFILVYDSDTSKVMEYQMIDAYPQSVMETPVSWGDQDNVCRLGVVFQYRDYVMRTASPDLYHNILDFTSPRNIQGVLNNTAMNVPRRIVDDLRIL